MLKQKLNHKNVRNFRSVIFFSAMTLTCLTLSSVPVVAIELPLLSKKANNPAAEGRLVGAQFQACLGREAAMKAIMDRIIRRGESQFAAVGAVSVHTQTFYGKSGKKLVNYQELIAAHDARKAAVQSYIDNLKKYAAEFACGGENPKGDLKKFETDSQALFRALDDHKNSVISLIVGNKSIQGADAVAGRTR